MNNRIIQLSLVWWLNNFSFLGYNFYMLCTCTHKLPLDGLGDFQDTAFYYHR